VREREMVTGPFFHSYARNALRTYASILFIGRADVVFLFTVYHLRRERRGPLGHQRKYFHCNEGPPSLHFRLRRPHRSFAYPAGLPRIVTPKFVAACD
jgi:hypothetical protein